MLVLTVSTVCRKRNDNAVGQPAGPQWTGCHRCPAAFPSQTARSRNLPPVAASPQLPAYLRLRPSGAVRPRIRSVACSTAIGNLPSAVQKTGVWALRLRQKSVSSNDLYVISLFHSRLVRSLTGRGQERCNAAACWFMTAAAWVRRLPLGLLKSTVLTLYLQIEHLNAVPPFIGFVV